MVQLLTADDQRASRDTRARAVRVIAVTIAVIVIQWLMVTAYAWSTSRSAPRDVPVAVTGPASAGALEARLGQVNPGSFRFIPVPDAAAARREIAGRIAYGAIVVPAAGGAPRVLVATAASPAIAHVLTVLAGELDGVPEPVRELAPLSPNDPAGAATDFTIVPVVITSIIAGVLLTLAVPGALARLAALLAFGAGGGAVTALVTHTWLAVTVGNYFILAAVLGLAGLAISASVAGLGAITGRLCGRRLIPAGLGLGAAISMLLGTPFSGALSAPEMLPGGWGAFGQWLPPGALTTLLRAVEYFGGHRSGGSWAVLAIWTGIGMALVIVRGGSHD